MKEIPLLRVRYAVSFANELTRIGAPTEKLLNEVGLSEDMLTLPDNLMPVAQMWRLTELSAGYTGLWDFGLKAGLTPLAEHSEFGHQLMFAPTLYQSILTFCQLANTEQSNANFFVKEDHDKIWFCGGKEQGTDQEIQQVELYRLGMMVQMIKAAIGPDWLLKDLQLQTTNAYSLRDCELVRNTDVQFGSYCLAVGIPNDMVSKPMLPPTAKGDAKNHGNGKDKIEPIQSYEQAIKEIVRTHVKVNRTNATDIANALNLPLRTFQRHLKKQNLSYSQLLDQVRMETAMELLKNPSTKITDIALESGYSEAPHFIRAFKRINGITPKQYRNNYLQPQLLAS